MSVGLPRPSRDEVLADTEETFRAVARILGSVDASTPPAERWSDSLGPLKSLTRFLVDSYGELARIMEGLRETRGFFRHAEVERLQTTHLALKEVTSQTEVAATDMLDGLERCLGLVDRIGERAPDVGGEEDPRDALRDELHLVIQHLQFQDIASQRIGYASQVLADVEARLAALMLTLEGYGLGGGDCEDLVPPGGSGDREDSGPVTCDPYATTRDADTRQALADELFG